MVLKVKLERKSKFYLFLAYGILNIWIFESNFALTEKESIFLRAKLWIIVFHTCIEYWPFLSITDKENKRLRETLENRNILTDYFWLLFIVPLKIWYTDQNNIHCLHVLSIKCLTWPFFLGPPNVECNLLY